MWYVIQVSTGGEHNIQAQCEARIPSTVLSKCFIPCYEEKRKVKGEWKIVERLLFPGYVFLVTEQVEELYFELQKVIGMTKLLGTEDEIIPLKDSEVEFLQSFGGEKQIVEMSTGIIEGSKVIVESGPLKGREGLIKKIDRHKRKAYLELDMFGRSQRVEVGLEITMKTID
jgi:transcriptional antiterminator NusG